MTRPSSADEFPQYYPDATATSFDPDSTVLPITELPGYVHDSGGPFEPPNLPQPVEHFSDATMSPHAAGEPEPFTGFSEPAAEASQRPAPQVTPQPAPMPEPVAHPKTHVPETSAEVNEPPAPEQGHSLPDPDWFVDLPLDQKYELNSILRSTDRLYNHGASMSEEDKALIIEQTGIELKEFLRQNKLSKHELIELFEARGLMSSTDKAVLNATQEPKFRIRLPRWRSKTQSTEAVATDSEQDEILPIEVDPDSGKITSRWDAWKVINKAQRDELARRLGLDKTVQIGNLEVGRGRLIGGILGAVALGATVLTAITLLRQGDTSAVEAASGGTGGGLDSDTSSTLPETTTPETSDTATPSSPIDTPTSQPPESPLPDADTPDTPPAGPDVNTAPAPTTERVTVEAGDTVYGLGHERGLTDTQIANGIEDGSIKAYDGMGNQVNVHDIQPGYDVDFNANATPAPAETPVLPPAAEVQPDIPAGSEAIQMEQGGTLSESVQDWLEQHGKADNVHNATEVVMNYNQSLGINLNGDTAHNLHSTNIGGQAVATLNGQPIQMPPEAMFDQMMAALESSQE